jgi:hypothetical protein
MPKWNEYYPFYGQDLKFDKSNGVHNFTLFKYLKDVPTLTSFTLLDATTLNPNLLFEMDSI